MPASPPGIRPSPLNRAMHLSRGGCPTAHWRADAGRHAGRNPCSGLRRTGFVPPLPVGKLDREKPVLVRSGHRRTPASEPSTPGARPRRFPCVSSNVVGHSEFDVGVDRGSPQELPRPRTPRDIVRRRSTDTPTTTVGFMAWLEEVCSSSMPIDDRGRARAVCAPRPRARGRSPSSWRGPSRPARSPEPRSGRGRRHGRRRCAGPGRPSRPRRTPGSYAAAAVACRSARSRRPRSMPSSMTKLKGSTRCHSHAWLGL